MYNYDKIKTDVERKEFLLMGETWWWESNRLIPINIFLRNDMTQFRYAIQTMNSKDVNVKFGPAVNSNDLAAKRVKRRSVQLIRKNK